MNSPEIRQSLPKICESPSPVKTECSTPQQEDKPQAGICIFQHVLNARGMVGGGGGESIIKGVKPLKSFSVCTINNPENSLAEGEMRNIFILPLNYIGLYLNKKGFQWKFEWIFFLR